jgi:2-polyprenyl-3-methyl-5-hydroxy-6-metoxy-1,4-benzoquinol methylase
MPTQKEAVFHVEQKEEVIESCPICGSTNSIEFLRVPDHSHSKKVFSIVSCGSCGFKYTNPRPVPEHIASYYEFEDYISHSNAKRGLVNKIYQAARSYALIKKLQLVLKVSKKKGPILDYGCGTGEFLNVCKKAGWEVAGVEPSPSARAQAIKQYGLDVTTPENVTPGSKFQVITLWHVLEHLPDLNTSFELFKSKLNADGTLIIAVPNPTSYEAEKYKEFWAAYDVPRHFYHFRPEDINALAEKHTMKVVETLPMLLDAFYISLLSEKYKTGKNKFIKAFFTGLRSNLNAIKNKNRYSSQIYVLKNVNKAI